MRRERAAVMVIDGVAHWLLPIWGRADNPPISFFLIAFAAAFLDFLDSRFLACS